MVTIIPNTICFIFKISFYTATLNFIGDSIPQNQLTAIDIIYHVLIFSWLRMFHWIYWKEISIFYTLGHYYELKSRVCCGKMIELRIMWTWCFVWVELSFRFCFICIDLLIQTSMNERYNVKFCREKHIHQQPFITNHW